MRTASSTSAAVVDGPHAGERVRAEPAVRFARCDVDQLALQNRAQFSDRELLQITPPSSIRHMHKLSGSGAGRSGAGVYEAHAACSCSPSALPKRRAVVSFEL